MRAGCGGGRDARRDRHLARGRRSDGGGGGTGEPAPNGVPAGPPFPDPETDRAVYDQAGVFSKETIANAEATIDAIEARTGAEVVVYSQVGDYGITTDEADGHAQALMDQWGVGRKGFDDGLVILFDLDPSREHGQVILYGGPGYRAAYLDNAEKQKIFDEDMLPLLQQGDLDGALNAALEKVDANATPEHAQSLQLARQVDAAVGLIGAPVVFLVLVGSGAFAWMRYGRDPVYLDDPSIHMAGPPRDLTPAAGAFVLAGSAVAPLADDGAARPREPRRDRVPPGERAARARRRRSASRSRPPAADPNEEARRARNGVRPIGPAEDLARRRARDARPRRPATSSPTISPGVRTVGPEVRQGARGRGDPQRLVPREAVEGHVALGDPRGRSPSSSASLAIVGGPEPPELGAARSSAARRSPAGSRSSSWRAGCRRCRSRAR